MPLNRTLYFLEVLESDKGREYWASQSWSNPDAIRAADVLVLPWEKFREDKPALFPQGTADFFTELVEGLGSLTVAMAVNKTAYEEVVLHSDYVRLPTLMATVVVIPILINLVSAKIDRWLVEPGSPSHVEMEIVVEGERGKCISIKYKGPPSGMIDAISKQAEACMPKKIENGKRPGKR